jgi:hypothetical protein
VNPVIGAPPTLEWIAVERLAIDESYQRATDGPHSRKLIGRISQCWNWHLCQPLVLSRRLDGSLFVIDGQHRLSAAIVRGDIPHLPCVVVSGQSGEDEARTFVQLNTQRQRLSQSDIFNGLLAAGDEVAKRAACLLAETGWRQTRTSSDRWRPGELFCAPMIVKALKTEGEIVVRNALTSLREAYETAPVRNTSVMLKALFLIFRRKQCAGEPDIFIRALGSAEDSTDWDLLALDQRRASPQLSRVEAHAAAIVATYEVLLEADRLAA